MRNGMKKDAAAPATMPGGAGGAPANAGPDPRKDAVAQAPAAMPSEPPTTPAVPAAKPKLYRVMNGGTIVWNSCRTVLRAGKEVSSKDYPIAMLRRQGIRLEPVDPSEYDEEQPQASATSGAQGLAPILVPGTPEARAAAEQISKMVGADGKPLPVPSPQFSR